MEAMKKTCQSYKNKKSAGMLFTVPNASYFVFSKIID